MKYIDAVLNRVTMYRLVVYGLSLLVVAALIASLLGRFSVTPVELLLSLGLLCGSAYVFNRLFASIWKVPTNTESWLITALILFFVLQPVNDLGTGLALILAGAISSASKFIFAPFGKHIFNPAAIAASVVSLAGILPSTWWVGTSALWPFTLILGMLVARKIRRFSMYGVFIALSLLLQSVQFFLTGQPVFAGLSSAVTASPLLFLAGIMLTEPSTMPPRRYQQLIFASIVSIFYVGAWEFGPLIIYPEVALLIGNIFAFVLRPKDRYELTLQRIERISDRIFNYVFLSDRVPKFTAGQFMEWTLAGVPGDGRGNRRSFTIASAPDEDTVQVGVKYYEPSSSYKITLRSMKVGDRLVAGQIAGNFTLAKKPKEKSLMIAGGIGVTPFRAMIADLLLREEKQDIILLHGVPDECELAYRKLFEDAASVGVRFIPIIGGRIDDEVMVREVADLIDRTVYISGPELMVREMKHMVKRLGVPSRHIRTDYFSGY